MSMLATLAVAALGIGGWLQSFSDDPTVRTIYSLVVADLVFAVIAAVVITRDFHFARVVDFLRDDVLGKVLPYFALWVMLHVSGLDFQIGGLDVIEEATGAGVIAALLASLLGTLKELKVPVGAAGNPPTE